MTYLGIVNLVHPANFEAGFNAERTFTTYGSINNIPVSYGPYVLKSWKKTLSLLLNVMKDLQEL